MRRLIKNKRGMSGVIGAIFTVIIFLAGFSFIMLQVSQYDNHQQVINDRTRLDQEKKNEVIEISQPHTEGTTSISFDVTNQGSVTAHVVALWLIEYSGSTATNQFGPISESTYINPASTVPLSITPPESLNPDKSYMVKVVTERGNIATMGWASLSTALTIIPNPSVTKKDDTVTLSGILTFEGSGLNGKTINLSYFTGSGWQTIGTTSTSSDGSYLYAWAVSSPAGNYRLKADFGGDASYPACSAESDILVTVLPFTALTISFSPITPFNKGATATISGILTAEGTGVQDKTINIFRSDGSNWVLIGTDVTSATGAYSLMWTIPSALHSGNYNLKAVFDGDSEYPTCNRLSSSSIQVLLDTTLTLSYTPPEVNRAETATISGTLTTEGTALSGKTVNLYRSDGTNWVLLNSVSTSGSGAYSYAWTVPTDIPIGYYRLRAVFVGDASYPGCSVECDPLGLEVSEDPVLTIIAIPSTVYNGEPVALIGTLSSEGLGIPGKNINLFRSNDASWVAIGTATTSAGTGDYLLSWTVPTDLSSGTYRFRAVFNGDSEYPTCFADSNSVTVSPPVVPAGTGGDINVGPFVLIFSDQSFTSTADNNPAGAGGSPLADRSTPLSAFEMDNDLQRITFSIQIKNKAASNIQFSSQSFFLVEVRELSGGSPGTTEYERYFHIVSPASTYSNLQSYADYSQTIQSNETATLKFAATAPGGNLFLDPPGNVYTPLQGDNGNGNGNTNLLWTFLVIYWKYEGTDYRFGQTIAYTAIRTLA